MKTLAIIDPTSMVGNMIFQELKNSTKFVLVCKDRSDIELLELSHGGTEDHDVVLFDVLELFEDYTYGFNTELFGPKTKNLINQIGQVDSVINCMTIVKPHLLKNMTATYFINATLPHLLSRIFSKRLIHLSTDCVFSGISGSPFSENASVSPNDLYGLTRSLGESYKQSLVLRASTIGPEIKNFDSLFAWVKKHDGQSIKGFTRHMWNGITTRQFALIIKSIINNRDQYPDHGLFHIFGSDISKFDMITAIVKKFKIKVDISPDDSQILDRRLRTVNTLNQQLRIPSFNEMVSML